jgi:cytochrome c553
MKNWLAGTFLVACGVLVGSGLTLRWQRGVLSGASDQPQNALPTMDSLPMEVARLKSLVPSQSHAMMDVQFHWTNLWFAAQHKNWPLAQFYFDESRQHMTWMIRIRPVRQGPDGKDVDLRGIFSGIDNSSLAAVKEAIEQKDGAKFAATYKTMLESCYACHKASGKPYLRPMIPESPDQSMINFDPDATWPQ